jgi:hypothetical protein
MLAGGETHRSGVAADQQLPLVLRLSSKAFEDSIGFGGGGPGRVRSGETTPVERERVLAGKRQQRLGPRQSREPRVTAGDDRDPRKFSEILDQGTGDEISLVGQTGWEGLSGETAPGEVFVDEDPHRRGLTATRLVRKSSTRL